MDLKAAIVRKSHFNSAHRLNNENWSDDKNRDVFGKCNNENFHGHNYDLEVKVIGQIDPQTGFVMNAKNLKEIIDTEVIDRYDHRNLNLDTQDFKTLNPTAENIAKVIYERIRLKINNEFELKIKLYETERNIVEYPEW
jgi:6-pyruvoyltetrahydropterin/6-carboxytetrahydropterin synthase